jgi:anti-sigma-K factor RskA
MARARVKIFRQEFRFGGTIKTQWLIENGQRTSGGVFSVSQEGYGSLRVSSPQPLSNYSAFGITVEPVGGSPGPTGNKVLGSPL